MQILKVVLTQASQDVMIHEAEHSNLGDIEHLLAKKKEFMDQIRVNKGKLLDLKVRLLVSVDDSLQRFSPE
jgi:hypothetical protein